MKTRIKALLQEQLKKKPSSFLRKQLINIDVANISTIDAFCLDVIHRFYYLIDLDPSFSILTDETQAALLKERALTEVERERLDQQDVEFSTFYDNFAGDREAQAPRHLLLDLYNQAMTKANYPKWLRHLELPYQIKADTDLVMSDLWQNQIKPYLVMTFSELEDKFEAWTTNAQLTQKELAPLKQQLTVFYQRLHDYSTALKQDVSFDQQRELLRACSFEGLIRKSKKWDEDILDFYEDSLELRESAKKLIKKNFIAFYAVNNETQQIMMQRAGHIVHTISQTELAFIKRFNALKREQNLLDYSDMEQLAYQILSQDTSGSNMARNFYQQKFDEIFVDEYQDINPLQEQIIQSLKKTGCNTLFMVGDLKQSIYGFREADPSLFLKKYHTYQKNDQQELIRLTDNFRSTAPITKFVNQIFDGLLTRDFGGIDYAKEGRLKFGARYYPDNLPKATEFLYTTPKKDQAPIDNELSADSDQDEIEMVLDRIKQLQKTKTMIYDQKTKRLRVIQYSDIAILTRSRSHNLEIMRAFSQHNVPLYLTDVQNYFQTFELTMIMNYLRLIDNPDQDIPLASVLRSPLWHFSEADLATIRIKTKNSSFYEAIASYALEDNPLGYRCKRFLNQLDAFRSFAVKHRISELIWQVYQETNLLEIVTAMPNGEQRRVNLQSLYERATSYESAGFKGLYQFIDFMTRMRESQKDLAQPLLSQKAENAVKLMTIHGAKGLQFPVVFYLGLHHRFQMQDLSSDYIMTNDALGLTVTTPDYRIDTLVKAIATQKKRQQMLEEEARIIYVALTRAQQKLILVAKLSSAARQIVQWQKESAHFEIETFFEKLEATSPLDFIGPRLKLDQHVDQTISDVTPAVDQTTDYLQIHWQQETAAAEIKKQAEFEKQELSPKLIRTIKHLYDFQYPFADATQTTAYQSVSEIKNAFSLTDPDEAELENSHVLTSTNRYLQPIETKPDFLVDKAFTGAELGTAMHLILQYYDYHQPFSQEKLNEEIHRLIAQDKLNHELVSHLSLDQIQWFVESSFAAPFRKHPDRLKREASFSSLLRAETLFPNFSDPTAKILVHGTIDGYYQGDKGITLFDYKTDYVDPTHEVSAIEKIKKRYNGQLRLYEQALNQFSANPVIDKYLILLSAKKWVKVN